MTANAAITIGTAQPAWAPEDFRADRPFTDTHISLAKRCAMAEIIGYAKGLVHTGEVSEGHAAALGALIEKYEATR